MNHHFPIWAKSIKRAADNNEVRIITLGEHTEHLLSKFENLRDFIPQELHEPIRIAIILHDIGKVLPSFQRRKLGNRDYKPFDALIDIDHSILSTLLVNKEKLRELIQNEDYEKFILSAVAFHHWRDKFEDLIRYGSDQFQKLKSKSDDFKAQLIHNLQSEMHKIENIDYTLIAFDEYMLEGLANKLPFVNYVIPPYQLYFLPQRIDISEDKKKDWILIAGNLMRCDHFASYCEEDNMDYPIEISNIEYDQIKALIQNKFNGQKLWQLKYIDHCIDKNTILIAPTGMGKTEFAFLWSNGKKFFYTLPFRAAVEQIFERAKNIFNSDKTERVGILHSDADVYLIEQENEESSIKLYDNARQLAFAVNISTGDQFFPYSLRPPGFEKIYSTFAYSNLVIDEVQAYDPKASAIVVKYVEDIIKMGGNVLLMTATFPEFIKVELKKRVEELTLNGFEILDLFDIEEYKFKKLIKHKIQLIKIENSRTNDNKVDFSFPDELINQIIEQGRNKRVLVICNTIKQAQDVYYKLKQKINNEIDLYLLHSRFTFDDRKKKQDILTREFSNPKTENEDKGKILVATQVIEAALDIDADVLYTELAPMDVLVQRMGRVLRRYRENYTYEGPPNVNIILFKEKYESGNSKVYNSELLELTLILVFIKLFQNVDADNLNDIIPVAKSYFEYKNSRLKIKDSFKNDLNNISTFNSKSKGKKGKRNQNISTLNFSLSEYDKYQLTNALYSLIDDQSNYKQEFYKTLNTLDAGYMAESRQEAQKIFRPMVSTSVISKLKLDQLKDDILKFFNNYGNSQRIFTLFKEYIISRYVVNVIGMRERNPLLKLERWISNNFTSEEIDEINLNRLKRWTRDIYLTDANYSEEIGLEKEIETKIETQFL
ncbi:MAG: CRISPR-associated helicase Cas3' [Ignavibacteria bacterium]